MEEPPPINMPVSPTHSNEQLLEHYLRHRDDEAFAELVRRFGPMVLGVSRRLLAFHEDADDATQLVFAELARRAGTIENPQQIGSWLHTLTIRVAHRMRMRRPETEPLASDPVDPRLSLDDLGRRSDIEVLSEELDQLPSAWREPLLLRYFAGLSNAEGAAELGTSEMAYEGRLKRARNSLRVRLLRRGVGATGLLAMIGPAAVSADADHWAAVTDAACELAADPATLTFLPPESTTMTNSVVTLKGATVVGVAALVLAIMSGSSVGNEPAEVLSPVSTVVAEERTAAEDPVAVEVIEESQAGVESEAAEEALDERGSPTPEGFVRFSLDPDDWEWPNKLSAEDEEAYWRLAVAEISREIPKELGSAVRLVGTNDQGEIDFDVLQGVPGLAQIVQLEIMRRQLDRAVAVQQEQQAKFQEDFSHSILGEIQETLREELSANGATIPAWVQERIAQLSDEMTGVQVTTAQDHDTIGPERGQSRSRREYRESGGSSGAQRDPLLGKGNEDIEFQVERALVQSYRLNSAKDVPRIVEALNTLIDGGMKVKSTGDGRTIVGLGSETQHSALKTLLATIEDSQKTTLKIDKEPSLALPNRNAEQPVIVEPADSDQ